MLLFGYYSVFIRFLFGNSALQKPGLDVEASKYSWCVTPNICTRPINSNVSPSYAELVGVDFSLQAEKKKNLIPDVRRRMKSSRCRCTCKREIHTDQCRILHTRSWQCNLLASCRCGRDAPVLASFHVEAWLLYSVKSQSYPNNNTPKYEQSLTEAPPNALNLI